MESFKFWTDRIILSLIACISKQTLINVAFDDENGNLFIGGCNRLRDTSGVPSIDGRQTNTIIDKIPIPT